MRPPADRKELFYWFWRGALRVGLLLNNRLMAVGCEHVPAHSPCFIVANHVSFLIPPAIGASIAHRVVRFMARDTLFKGLFGWGLRRVCVIPLSREKGDVAALRKAIELLKAGHCVGLFPEGTRSVDGSLQKAKSGIGFLLSKAGVPVVPAYIQGTYEAYPKGARRIGRNRVSVFFGPAIQPGEFAAVGTGRAAYDQVGQLVMARIAALRPADTGVTG